MRHAMMTGWLLGVLLAAPVVAGADAKPAEVLAALKREVEELNGAGEGPKPGSTEAVQEAAVERYLKRAADIGRRALALVDSDPDAPEAAIASAWILHSGLGDLGETRDAAYDRMAGRYLDNDVILPVIRTAWYDADKSAHAGAFLRAAVERSRNLGVRALACYTLGRHQQQLVLMSRLLDDPIRGKVVEGRLGPETVRRIRSVKPEEAKREAVALYERTLGEFSDLQP